ncbi:hypothetical protein MMC25_006620 [Agyrium rufum]|nr:hypothetical protein [Agyrium rufum]
MAPINQEEFHPAHGPILIPDSYDFGEPRNTSHLSTDPTYNGTITNTTLPMLDSQGQVNSTQNGSLSSGNNSDTQDNYYGGFPWFYNGPASKTHGVQAAGIISGVVAFLLIFGCISVCMSTSPPRNGRYALRRGETEIEVVEREARIRRNRNPPTAELKRELDALKALDRAERLERQQRRQAAPSAGSTPTAAPAPPTAPAQSKRKVLTKSYHNNDKISAGADTAIELQRLAPAYVPPRTAAALAGRSFTRLNRDLTNANATATAGHTASSPSSSSSSPHHTSSTATSASTSASAAAGRMVALEAEQQREMDARREAAELVERRVRAWRDGSAGGVVDDNDDDDDDDTPPPPYSALERSEGRSELGSVRSAYTLGPV